MTTSKLTIIAQMRDELTGPLKHAQKTMDQLAAASRKSAAAADMQSAAFVKLAKAQGLATDSAGRWRNAQGHYVSNTKVQEAASRQQVLALNKASGATGKQAKAFEAMAFAAGWSITAQGRVRDAQGRYVSSTNIAVARTMANAEAHRKLGVAQNETKVFTEQLGASVKGFSAHSVRTANRVEQLGKAFGMSGASARRFGLGMSRSIDNGAISRGVDAYNRNLDRMKRHTDRVTSDIKQKLSTMGKAFAVGGTALGAYTLAAGMKRHQAFQTADVRLEVMDFTPEQREEIKATTNELVTGTPIPLDAAMTGGQKLLQAGIELDDFERRMDTMVNATSLYSAFDPEQLPHVMGQITSKRFLTGEEMLQLAELGLNPTRVMAEHLQLPLEDIMPMVEAKEITADMFWDALEPWVEDGAKKMGETFVGAWMTMKAAIARVGEDFETPVLQPLEDLMRLVTESLDEAEPIWLAFGEAAAVGIEMAIDILPQLVALLNDLAPAFIELAQAGAKVLPRLAQGFIIWFDVISPIIDPMVRLLALTLELTSWTLPVLIPLLIAAGHGFAAWKILSGINALLMIFWPTLNLATVAITAARWAVNLFSTSLLMFPGTWIVAAILLILVMFQKLYDEVDAVREVFDWVSDAMRNAGEWLDNLGDKIEEFLTNKFPKLAKINEAVGKPLTVVQETLQDSGAAMGEDTGLHKMLGTGKYFGSGEGALRMFHGSGSHDENGNPVGADPNAFYAPAATSREEKHRRYVDSAPEELVPYIDPSNVPQEKHAEGGWTSGGDYVAGERGREFITSAWASNSIEAQAPGALSTMNATGQIPTGDTVVYAPININGAQDPQVIAAIVRTEITRVAREDTRNYMKTTARGAG